MASHCPQDQRNLCHMASSHLSPHFAPLPKIVGPASAPVSNPSQNQGIINTQLKCHFLQADLRVGIAFTLTQCWLHMFNQLESHLGVILLPGDTWPYLGTLVVIITGSSWCGVGGGYTVQHPVGPRTPHRE